MNLCLRLSLTNLLGLVCLTPLVAQVLDPTFQPTVLQTNAGYSGGIRQAFSLTSGQLLVTGSFDIFNGVSVPAGSGVVRRVNANGALDLTFVSPEIGSTTGLICGTTSTGS